MKKNEIKNVIATFTNAATKFYEELRREEYNEFLNDCRSDEYDLNREISGLFFDENDYAAVGVAKDGKIYKFVIDRGEGFKGLYLSENEIVNILGKVIFCRETIKLFDAEKTPKFSEELTNLLGLDGETSGVIYRKNENEELEIIVDNDECYPPKFTADEFIKNFAFKVA